MPTIASSPATFTPAASVNFAIPAGVYTSASMFIWHGSPTATSGANQIGLGVNNIVFPSAEGEEIAITTGSWHQNVLLSQPLELADINAAAGGNLSIALGAILTGVAIGGFTLSLVSSATGGGGHGGGPIGSVHSAPTGRLVLIPSFGRKIV